jgi:predicted sulfurtransferase
MTIATLRQVCTALGVDCRDVLRHSGISLSLAGHYEKTGRPLSRLQLRKLLPELARAIRAWCDADAQYRRRK